MGEARFRTASHLILRRFPAVWSGPWRVFLSTLIPISAAGLCPQRASDPTESALFCLRASHSPETEQPGFWWSWARPSRFAGDRAFRWGHHNASARLSDLAENRGIKVDEPDRHASPDQFRVRHVPEVTQYQRVISGFGDLPCRFRPTCAQWAGQSAQHESVTLNCHLRPRLGVQAELRENRLRDNDAL